MAKLENVQIMELFYLILKGIFWSIFFCSPKKALFFSHCMEIFRLWKQGGHLLDRLTVFLRTMNVCWWCVVKFKRLASAPTTRQIIKLLLLCYGYVFVKAKHGIRLSSFVVLASSMAQKTKVIFGFTFPNLYFTSPYCTKKKNVP